jgi:transcriptional regulator with XRE-family HTH domain
MAQRELNESDRPSGLAGPAPREHGHRSSPGRSDRVDGSDTAADSVEEFAHDLRQLRHANNFPKLTTMQFHTGISKSTISAALKGDRLPSEKTVRALTSFFGADMEEWSRRRRALDRHTPAARTEPEVGFNPETGLLETPSIEGPLDQDAVAAVSDERPETSVPTVKQHLLLLTAASVAVLTACATSLVWFALSTAQSDASASTIEHYVDFSTGVDPMLTVCRKDGRVVASEDRLDGAVFVEVIYSDRCHAAWGRVTRYDAKTADNSIHMTVYLHDDPAGSKAQEATASNQQSVHTPLLVRTDDDGAVCGAASITRGGEEYEAEPVCF